MGNRILSLKQAAARRIVFLRLIARLVAMHRTLRDYGWYRSARTGLAFDVAGHPIPWWQYSAISFLDSRLRSHMRVFEFGAGHSTIWLSQRVKEVWSAELSSYWVDHLMPLLPSNVQVIHVHEREALPTAIAAHGMFEIVVVDTTDSSRGACAQSALPHLTDDGVLIWDDSDRSSFRNALPGLLEIGFRELVFEGLKPISSRIGRTSILYREGNCLGI